MWSSRSRVARRTAWTSLVRFKPVMWMVPEKFFRVSCPGLEGETPVDLLGFFWSRVPANASIETVAETRTHEENDAFHGSALPLWLRTGPSGEGFIRVSARRPV